MIRLTYVMVEGEGPAIENLLREVTGMMTSKPGAVYVNAPQTLPVIPSPPVPREPETREKVEDDVSGTRPVDIALRFLRNRDLDASFRVQDLADEIRKTHPRFTNAQASALINHQSSLGRCHCEGRTWYPGPKKNGSVAKVTEPVPCQS